MASSTRPEGRDGVLSTLDVFIQGLTLAKDTCGVPPAQVAFGAAGALLTMIRVCFPSGKTNFWLTFIQDTMTNDQDYIDLGRTCSDVCQKLYRRLKGRQPDDLNQSVLDAIGDLTA